MKLSICIPTYNRKDKIPNCLNSIYLASKNSNLEFDVCISDNGSDYDLFTVIKEFDKKLNIKINTIIQRFDNIEDILYHLVLSNKIEIGAIKSLCSTPTTEPILHSHPY